MKKLVLFICFTFVTLSLFASKADPTVATITQSDGTTLRICLHGNMEMSWYSTTDGVILKQKDGNYYVANINEQGILSSSDQLAHEENLRNDIEKKLVKAQNRDLFISKAKETIQKNARKIPIADVNPPYFPHMGNPKVLVILAEFSDLSFTDSNAREVFDSYLNTEGHDSTFTKNATKGTYTLTNSNYGSVSQYFNDMSFGAFRPQFDVYGPYKVNKSAKSYNKVTKDSVGNIIKITRNYDPLVVELCDSTKNDIDFSLYDSNNDNYIDLIYIIYAGYGSNITGNDEELIWPLVSVVNSGNSYNGKRIYRYGISQELNGHPGSYTTQPDKQINGIGVFCHEFSHAMGLPDMYPKSTAVWDNQEMEAWDIMDCGCYYGSRCPSAYTAWEREAMGWMNVDTLVVDEKNIEFDPIDFGGKAYRFMNPNDKNKREYFMLENVQDRKWNKERKAHGLLVYHVNYASDVVRYTDHPNDVEGKPRIAVVPADGWVMSSYKIGKDINPVTDTLYTTSDFLANIAGDPFPGTHNVTELKYDMNLPNYKWQIVGRTTEKVWEEVQPYNTNRYWKLSRDTLLKYGINTYIFKQNGPMTAEATKCYKITQVKQGDKFRITGFASGSTCPFYILTGKNNVVKAVKYNVKRNNTPVILEITSDLLEEGESGILYINLEKAIDGDKVEKEVYSPDPEVKQALVNIREDYETGKITFDFVTDITDAIDRTIVEVKKANNDAIYTLDGRKVNQDINQLHKGIYIQNNKKFIVK